MFNEKTLAYYFPSTVVLVDDDKAYLENIENMLNRERALYKLFYNPKEVYNYLTKNYKPHPLLAACIKQEIDSARGHRNIDINLYPIQEEVYNPKRFEYITVVVADHDMPEMKGLELFRQLKDVPVKKILLTGVASPKEALDAFNEGIIDQFISKNAPDFEAQVNLALTKLSHEKFAEDTAIIINNLIMHRQGYEPSCLNDLEFIKLFDSLIEEHHICEYYLIDDSGSYVLFDINGKPSWLIVKNEDDCETDIILAQDSDEPPAPEVINKLKQREYILCMLTAQDREAAAKEWEVRGLLHPAKKIAGSKQTYYYAYFDKGASVDKDKILSFRAYQEKA